MFRKSGPRFSEKNMCERKETLLSDFDARARPKMDQKPTQIGSSQRNAAGSRRPVRPRHMHEHRAAHACDARTGVVGDLDHQVIKVVAAPQPITWFIGRPSERAVVAAVPRVFAPRKGAVDSSRGQQRRRPCVPISPPPEAKEPKAPARCCAIALALVGRDAGAAEHNRDSVRSGEQHPLRNPPRCAMHPQQRKATLRH
jgi:hypothetical protein